MTRSLPSPGDPPAVLRTDISSRASRRTSAVAWRAERPGDGDPLLDFAPVPHKQPRRNSITPELQREFIAELAASGIVTQAAKAIGKSLEALYKLRQRPGADEFRAAWAAALDRGVAKLEDCALARAIDGEERLVVSAGKVLGTEVRHNEALVQFFLRNRRPDRYGDGTLRGAVARGELVAVADLVPGHPVYERLRSGWRDVEEEPIEVIRERLAAKLTEMHERLKARQACE